jgi:hypothetical protein
VMAVGNTGEFLDFAADAMCTWLSRDGGATWEDVAPNAVRPLPDPDSPPRTLGVGPGGVRSYAAAMSGRQASE